MPVYEDICLKRLPQTVQHQGHLPEDDAYVNDPSRPNMNNLYEELDHPRYLPIVKEAPKQPVKGGMLHFQHQEHPPEHDVYENHTHRPDVNNPYVKPDDLLYLSIDKEAPNQPVNGGMLH